MQVSWKLFSNIVVEVIPLYVPTCLVKFFFMQSLNRPSFLPAKHEKFMLNNLRGGATNNVLAKLVRKFEGFWVRFRPVH